MLLFARNLGIDLGTSNVRIYQEKKGIVLRAPSVIAMDKSAGRVLQVGAAARNMLGRTPGNVVAIRPLRAGIISDYELTARMLTEMVRGISKGALIKPRVIISVSSGITEVEERTVFQAVMEAGARQVYIIEAPLAAALGAQIDVSRADGKMVVEIGGGTTDVGVLSLSGVAYSSSIPVAGMAFDDAIIKYLLRHEGILIGESTAEEIKMSIGCVAPRPAVQQMAVRGRDAMTGLAKDLVVTSEDMLEALRRPARQIVDEVADVLRKISPELVSDIQKNGIVLTGGGSQIWGMDLLIQERTGIKCMLADDADSCVARGCGKSLEWIGQKQEGIINIARSRLLRE